MARKNSDNNPILFRLPTVFNPGDEDIVRDVADVYKPFEVELTPAQRSELTALLDYYEHITPLSPAMDQFLKKHEQLSGQPTVEGGGGMTKSPARPDRLENRK